MDVNKPSHQLHEFHQFKWGEISSACLFKREYISGDSIKLHLQQQLNLLKRKGSLFKCELKSQISLLSHSVVYILLF